MTTSSNVVLAFPLVLGIDGSFSSGTTTYLRIWGPSAVPVSSLSTSGTRTAHFKIVGGLFMVIVGSRLLTGR
jgi:hypothetical protein